MAIAVGLTLGVWHMLVSLLLWRGGKHPLASSGARFTACLASFRKADFSDPLTGLQGKHTMPVVGGLGERIQGLTLGKH